jgi:hypothetical protein
LNEKQPLLLDTVKAFFTATLSLGTYNNPMQAKLAFIASSFSQIIAALRAAKSGKSVGSTETFKERDRRLAEQAQKEQDERLQQAALYKAQKEQILRFLNNKIPLTPEMLDYPAYNDMFGGGAF